VSNRHERRVDERYRAALRSPHEPTHPYESALWTFSRTKTGSDEIVRVVDAYEDAFEREILQAWIIAGATDEALSSRLGVAPEMVAPYRHLCCNPLVFRDKLELLRWVKNYQGSAEGKKLLERAVHFDGVEAVAHLCGLPTNLDAAHVNEQIMRETYFRGVNTLRGTHISSREAVEAHSLMRSAVAAAAATMRRGAPNMAEIWAKLKHRDLTYKADEVVPRAEIMN
jgi:hypothetical protein